MSVNKRYKVNERIQAESLRVIGQKGENLGVMTRSLALDAARKQGMDLVEIAPKSLPPVVKILDFKKFIYEERKKTSAAKAHTKQVGLKEFKFGPNIGANDLNIRIERAREFLKNKDRVKFTVIFKGREIAFPDIGWAKISRVTKELQDYGRLEDKPKLVNKTLNALYLPL
ncbi:translation initiation factor IF-3 [candidate division WWE3 bacterium]|nr:translation initiation factor IF-3 [candidate division WWE3 bacterium]